jgi:phosphate transport system permease protein
MKTRSWSRILAFALAMIPVVMLVLVVGSSFILSMRALVDFGLDGLFGPILRSRAISTSVYSYGLAGPIWGTILVAAVALILALPAAIAFAVLLTELPDGPLRRMLDSILTTLTGIPPIAYALMAIFFMEAFMRPKFSGWGINATWGTNVAVLQAILGWTSWDQTRLPVQMPNSTLLGGMLIGLLIQPFMTPLIRDALRRVPTELREASYALGAGRWHTLTRVVFPYSLPGIVAAVTLGTLKAIGDVTIAYFVIGSSTTLLHVPDPLLDVFAKTPSLAATGAGLIGGLGGPAEGARPDEISVAYFASLVLLVLGFAIMGAAALAERALRQRLSR